MEANNLSGAAYSLDKALSSQPDFLPAMALMAEVELRQGASAKAEKRARDVLALSPKRAVGHSLLGDIALAKGQLPAALDNYRRAHQAEPSTDTLLRLFRTSLKQDGGKPAQQLAEQWLKAHPKDLAVQKVLADSFAANGNFAVARTRYETVLKLVPDDAEVLNNLANVLLRLKDPGAIKVAEQAVAKEPSNPNLIDTLGWALFQGGQVDRALQLLREARLRQPGNPEIRFHLAVALAQTGRRQESKEELDEALKLGSNFESAAEAKKLLQSFR
jgi:Flp pilus assembly protein TadD